MRIGIYGGTFGPVHMGHVRAARAFMEQMWLDVLYVIPAGIPPHKVLEAGDDPRHRLRMCELAFGGMEGVIVSDMEIRRGGMSYTVDTLRELSGEGNRLFLLCGTDMLLTLDTWHEAREIFKLCYPVYVRREADKTLDEKIVAAIARYGREYGAVIRKLVTEPLEISSTEVREAVAAGRDISKMVPPVVAAYIAKNHLYAKKNPGEVGEPGEKGDKKEELPRV